MMASSSTSTSSYRATAPAPSSSAATTKAPVGARGKPQPSRSPPVPRMGLGNQAASGAASKKRRWPRPRAWFALSVSLAFYLFDVFARLSVGVVTTTLQTEFHMAADEVSLVFGSSFFYAYAAMQLPWGFLMDGFGPRFSVAAACFLAAGGTALTGMAHSSGVGLLARIMTGAGCGGAWLGFIKVNRLEFRLYPRLSGSLLGLATCLGGVGALGSQKPFAAMVTAFGWRQAYIVSAALPFVLGICAMLLIRNTVQQPLQGTLVRRPFVQQRGGYGIVHASAAAAPPRNAGTPTSIGGLAGTGSVKSPSSASTASTPATTTTGSSGGGVAKPSEGSSSNNNNKAGAGAARVLGKSHRRSQSDGVHVVVSPAATKGRRLSVASAASLNQLDGVLARRARPLQQLPRSNLTCRQRLRAAVRPLGRLLSTPRLYVYAIFMGFTDAPWETFAGLWGVPALEQALDWSSAQATSWTTINVAVATVAMLCAGPLLALFSTSGQRLALLSTMAMFGCVGYVPMVVQASVAVPSILVMCGIVCVGLSVVVAPVLWEFVANDPLCNGASTAGLLSGVVNSLTIVLDAITQQAAGGVLTALWAGQVAPDTGRRVYTKGDFAALYLLLSAEFFLAACCPLLLATCCPTRSAKGQGTAGTTGGVGREQQQRLLRRKTSAASAGSMGSAWDSRGGQRHRRRSSFMEIASCGIPDMDLEDFDEDDFE